MAPSEGPIKELDEKCIDMVVKYVADIRSGKMKGSINIATATVSLLEQIITDSQNPTAFELCGTVRAVGQRVQSALPQELVAANMVRRVLRAIRDEQRTTADQSGEGAGESLQRLVLAAPHRRSTSTAPRDLREPVRDFIAELLGELESSAAAVCQQAREHVHADELVLTFGACALAERFLRAAAARRYRLLLAESGDVRQSHAMASRLSAAGVDVTVVSSAAVAALMPRVNKVILCVRAVLAGGTALARAGSHAVTVAAHHYSVPVLALAPLHTLSPRHACEQRDHRRHALAPPPSYQSSGGALGHVAAPSHDFLPPSHITLFITNLGGSSPSYIYRLLSELYDPSDYQI
ncbi:unnamed protein product, partial [Iphiclides podalirius]